MPLMQPQLPAVYHQLFASWLRIESRCRSADFAKGLEARTADPLWMLARQWQMGEFEGEDAGSPVRVDVRHQTETIDEVGLGDAQQPNISLRDAPPLEALVEREAVALDWRTRVQIGQHFERLARTSLADRADAVIIAYRTAFPIDELTDDDKVAIDRTTQRFLALVAGRAVDGGALLDAIHANNLPALPRGIGVTDAQVQSVIDGFGAWYEALHTQPAPGSDSAWRDHALDHRFRISAPHSQNAKTGLIAPDYRNGELDWYSFDLEELPAGEWVSQALEERFPPTRVSFDGMPHPRWWAFEDSRTDFGDLDVATPDLAKLMLMEFALVYGDDWFIVPLDVPIGSVTKINDLIVRDVFDIEMLVPPARTAGTGPLDRWELFSLSDAADPGGSGVEGILFVPPAVGFREESPPLEEVRFIRDEGANMVWAIEHTVPNGLGNPIDGFEAHRERRDRERERAAQTGVGDGGDAQTPGVTALPRYRLATTVPPNWIPFVPGGPSLFPGTSSRDLRLRRAQMLRNEDDAAPAPISSITELLDPAGGQVLWIDEEAVPRAGVKVQLTKQRIRWVDGETYVWLGRKVVSGRGEGSSGLRFDVLSFTTGLNS